MKKQKFFYQNVIVKKHSVSKNAKKKIMQNHQNKIFWNFFKKSIDKRKEK